MYIVTIDYYSKKYDEIALRNLKRYLMNKRNNEVPCKSAVNLNDSFDTSLKEHIKSFQSEIYFLREQIRQKNNFISSIFQKKHEDQLPDQEPISKHETNRAELENKVIEINSRTAELTKGTHIAITKNVVNLNSESSSSPMIENIQQTQEAIINIIKYY